MPTSERMVPLRVVQALIRVLGERRLVHLTGPVLIAMDPASTPSAVAQDLTSVLETWHAESMVAPLLALWEVDLQARPAVPPEPVVVPTAVMLMRHPLSLQEYRVLIGLAAGRSNLQIGRDMHLAENTVKTHCRRMFRKLGAHDRAHAVAQGYTVGLLPPARSADALAQGMVRGDTGAVA